MKLSTASLIIFAVACGQFYLLLAASDDDNIHEDASLPDLGNCTRNNDCPVHQRCDYEDMRCICKFGYTQHPNTTDCEPLVCTTNYNCTEPFGIYSACEEGRCQCHAPFEIDPETQLCKKHIGMACTSSLECGLHAGCYEGFCRCEFNHYVNDALFNCDLLPCYDDRQCQHHFGEHAHCRHPTSSKIPSKCGCIDPVDFYINEQVQRCIPRNTTRICKKDGDCGRYSLCENGICECLFGYIPNTDLTPGCRALHCLNDGECTTVFPNSQCTRKLNCECSNARYRLDEAQLRCTPRKHVYVSYLLAGGVVTMVVAPIAWFVVKQVFITKK